MSITGSNNPFACEPVVFANANSIVSLGTITRDGNQFTFSVGFVWKINGVTYQNTAPVVITIAEASTGFQRIDNALLNTSNTIELQQGLESATIALQPVAPDTNIILTSWNISGDAIEDTQTPIVGTQFKKKSENSSLKITATGEDIIINLSLAGQMHYIVTSPALISVAGFSPHLLNMGGNPLYPGQDLIFENQTGNPVTLINAHTIAPIKFNEGADIIVPNGGKIWFRINEEFAKIIMKSWSEVDLSTKLDKVSTAGVERVYTINPDGSQDTKATSDFGLTQTTITTSRTALATDNGHLIKIKGNATYIIDQSTLPTGWNVIVRTFTGATCTFVASAGTTFDAPTGLILKPLKMCSIIKDSDDNKILINGETSLT